MKLIEGDCLEKMKDLSDNSVDIVICDLPYGVFTKHLAWDKGIDLEKMWKQLWRIGKKNCPIFLFGDMKFGVKLINSCPKHFKYEIVWNKKKSTTPLLARRRIGKATEYVFIFYKHQPIYNYKEYHKVVKVRRCKNKKIAKCDEIMYHPPNSVISVYDPRLPINVIEGKTIMRGKIIKNITEKPQFLLEYLLKYFSNEGDTCLDMAMGSGSCGVACNKLKRNFIGIELNKKHFNLAAERLKYII